MSKKILAGVLAAASMLSLSVAASAEEKPNNQTYTITAKVTEGVVDVTFPTSMSAYLNPYNTAVKTGTGATAKKNTMGIASEIFELTNNDADEPVKVIASVTVTKATGVVVKDPATDVSSIKNYNVTGAEACDAVGSFNPLVEYTAITTKTDATTKEVSYVSGGAVNATQKKNVALWLVGDVTDTAVINKSFDKDATNMVAFPVKVNSPVSATIVPLVAKGGGKAYFAINGDVNPEYKGDWDTTGTKDALALTVILKCMPTVEP